MTLNLAPLAGPAPRVRLTKTEAGQAIEPVFDGTARSCPKEWCKSGGGFALSGRAGPVSSGCRDGGQLDEGIVAQRCDGFQGHVARALDGPFVVLLEQDGTDEPDDSGLVGEDADDLGAALDLAVEPFQRIGNRYEDRGAHSFGWDRLFPGVWCDHPGRGAPGARQWAGRCIG